MSESGEHDHRSEARRKVAIVPHTHWDREWYSSFQTFRLRLVDLLDQFLADLSSDLSYARFLLDGQMAVVEDYLEVRPEAEDNLRALAAGGRLSMGPWYILMDEFLVSGESIIRNLQRGLATAARFGGGMQIGYLPDMFGHVAQMPQILRAAGIEHAVVWRGVPSAVDRSAFWWRALDGSTVRAEYLVTGYGNGAGIPEDAKALVRRLKLYEEEVGSFLLDSLLFMNGTDHQVPQPWLGRVVAEVNEIQDEYHLEVTSLPEYLATAPTEGLPTWDGELRSGARANLLMGVASNRVDVKQAAARTERTIERLAEPLSALLLAPDAYPTSLLDIAWREVIRNSAHDSICACSIDEVCDAVVHRFAEARQIGDGLTTRALRALGRRLADPNPVALNPAARTRGGLIELDLPGHDTLEGVQVISHREPMIRDNTVAAAQLATALGTIRSQQLDEDTYINQVDINETDEGMEILLTAHGTLRSNIVMDEIKEDLFTRLADRPERFPVRIRIEQEPSQRIVTRVEDVPGYGWVPLLTSPPKATPVTVEGNTMTNGLVTVTIDASDGTFSLDGVCGLGRLVDDGDQGDTYNYSPPDNDIVVDRPTTVAVIVREDGPIRARIRVDRTYRWPERINDGTRSREGEREVEVSTTYELQAGEPFVRVHHKLFNTCRDHRLRAWFPLPTTATGSRAQCAFGIVERGLEAEGGPTERGLPTYPARRFVQAGGLTLAHEGLLEYEVVDNGGVLALTLLRATGMLSRVEMTYRPLPAGPPIHMEGPQMIGDCEARYVVTSADVDPYALADDAFLPLLVVRSRGTGDLPSNGQALNVTGAEVSALRRQAGSLELRVFNPSDEPTDVVVEGRTGWLVDLRGNPLDTFEGGFPLGPWQIATARLRD